MATLFYWMHIKPVLLWYHLVLWYFYIKLLTNHLPTESSTQAQNKWFFFFPSSSDISMGFSCLSLHCLFLVFLHYVHMQLFVIISQQSLNSSRVLSPKVSAMHNCTSDKRSLPGPLLRGQTLPPYKLVVPFTPSPEVRSEFQITAW